MMQGSSKKHDLSPGERPSEDSVQPNKKIRKDNAEFDSSEISRSPFNNSKNYLSKLSPSPHQSGNFQDISMERTYGSFRRNSFTKPIGYVDNKPSDRFSPYSLPPRKQVTPVVLRPRKQGHDVSDPNVTSTAQKIIETLASMSTPVANAKRVPIDSIKPIKPSFANLRRNIDYGGPPIMRSPLLPSSAKIVTSPSISNNISLRSLPKLVDSATNTDDTSHFESTAYGDIDKPIGGGKIRRNLNRIHAAPLKVPSTIKNDSTSSTSNHDKRNFSFGSPWSAEELMEAMSARKDEKVENSIATKSNDDDRDEKGDKSVIIEAKSPATSTKWNCPTCCVPNQQDALKCVCCSEKAPTPKVPNTTSTIFGSTPNVTVASTAGPLTNKSDIVKPWNCPTCMVPNKLEAPVCVCCGEKNPNAKSVDTAAINPSVPVPAFKFGISTTASTATTAVTTSSTSTFTFGSSSGSFGSSSTQNSDTPKLPNVPKITAESIKKWNCPTCMVPNAPDVPACVCCGEKNPTGIVSVSSAPTTTTTAEATPQFTFGFGTPNTNSDTTSTPKVVSVQNTVTPLAVPTTKTTTIPTITNEDKSVTDVAPRKLVFGGQSDKTDNSKKEQANIFSGFKFSTTTTATPTATKTTSSVAIPAENQVIEMWRCDICPANNSQNANQCIACGAKKTIGITKDQSPKKFTFPPFTGGRPPPTTMSTLSVQPPKASIFGGSKIGNDITSTEPVNSQKRKHTDETPEQAGFMYTSPEPKLKMKPIVDAPPLQTTTEIKTGSFLDAFKPPSTNVFSGTAPVVSSAATLPAPASTFVFGNPPSSTTTTALFQFGAQPNPSANSSFTFGSNPADKPPPTIFGAPRMPVLSTGMPQSLSTSLPQPAGRPFNLTPNLNFGVPVPAIPGLATPGIAAPAPAPLFQFQANTTPNDNSSVGGRKIRKATRRMK